LMHPKHLKREQLTLDRYSSRVIRSSLDLTLQEVSQEYKTMMQNTLSSGEIPR
jgi:hypothetical protein